MVDMEQLREQLQRESKAVGNNARDGQYDELVSG